MRPMLRASLIERSRAFGFHGPQTLREIVNTRGIDVTTITDLGEAPRSIGSIDFTDQFRVMHYVTTLFVVTGQPKGQCDCELATFLSKS